MLQRGIHANHLSVCLAVDQARKTIERRASYALAGVHGFSIRFVQQNAERQRERVIAKPLEIVGQFLDARRMAHGRIKVGRAGRPFRRIDAVLPVDVIKVLRLCVIRFEILITQRPCRGNTAVVRDVCEIFNTRPQQGRAINFRIAADVILNAGKKCLAVLVIPRLFGSVLGFDEDGLGVPVVFFPRQVSAAFEKQNSLPRRRQMVSERASTGSRAYDDDVVMIDCRHTERYWLDGAASGERPC